MLTVLEVLPERKRSLPARIWRNIMPPPVTARICRTDVALYVRISCERFKDRIDWRMICAHTLDAAGRILLPIGVSCPQGVELRKFVPHQFLRRMRENFAMETLLNMSDPPCARRIALYGQEAELCELLPKLIPLAGEIIIITRRDYAIREQAQEIMNRTGMPIILTDSMEVKNCHILLAPSGGTGVLKTEDVGAIISPDRPSSDDTVWVETMRASVPPALEEQYSACYDMMEFLGAFYEAAGVYELGKIYPEYALTSVGRLTPKELAERISGCC